MTALCPRCSTPRAGEYPICQVCGLDFRTPADQTAQADVTPAVQPPPVCQRCGAPLYPGYTMCGNCGFDPAQSPYGAAPGYGYGPAYGAMTPFGYAAPTVKRAGSKAPVLLAVLGVALLAIAGGLVFAVANKGAAPTGRPTASPVALATSTITARPTFDYSATSTPEPSGAPATAEPSPLLTWTSYTSPDKMWKVQLPSDSPPIKQTVPLNTGLAQGDMTMYAVYDSASTVYAVLFFDFPTGTIPKNGTGFLKTMESAMASSMGGKLVSSNDAVLGGTQGRELAIEQSSMAITLRMAFVGDRFYALMVMNSPGGETYPEHFFGTFSLK
jgi:hypothetical protein